MDVAARAISDSMARSKEAVDDIQLRAGEADRATERLTEAAVAMGDVATIIAGIAQQINLLH